MVWIAIIATIAVGILAWWRAGVVAKAEGRGVGAQILRSWFAASFFMALTIVVFVAGALWL